MDCLRQHVRVSVGNRRQAVAVTEILAFDPARRNNAQAIRDAHLLGYLQDDDIILDATYGLGRFWNLWKPPDPIIHLLDNDKFVDAARFHYDYRSFPDDWGGSFDVTVFDPPYKLNGTGGSHPSDEGYGVATPYQNIDEMLDGISDGFTECARVTKPGGFLLNKTQDQVVSGKKKWLTKTTWLTAMRGSKTEKYGLRLVDELYVVGYRPQPKGRAQKHARSNVSVLQIFQRSK